MEGATRFFDYLGSQPRTIQCLPLEVYNIVIEAHVWNGAPFSVVSRLFFKLKQMKIFPDKNSYSLLVKSTCRAGRLHTATDIFNEMVGEVEANPSDSLISVHILTMIMSAFLRQRNRLQAKEICDEMIKRGMQLSVVTYAKLSSHIGREEPQKVCG